ncbi:calcium-binding protein [Albimonas pacifica]|uniref:Hemolysin-type calcium-binding repeat-containing protein n=1 Tax=Albimonas pacifica TaxID=1114924 RepID=A0A1I3GBG5_9RHOB|nr:calcium-binding protein [Albimonas pacifica]SFI20757.1 Hemolysin-type calcium-binding repeat-containing protein [Albimonas pacifica]
MSATTKGRTLFGGNGTQSLRGTDGADTIYGDKAGEGGFELRLEDRDGGAEARRPGEMTLVTLGGEIHAYAAASGRGAGGAQAWRLDADAEGLTQVWSQDAMWYGLDDLLTGAPTLASARFGGQDYLITAGLGVSIATLDASGAPQLLDRIDWDWGNGLLRPGAVVPFEMGGELRILVAGGEEGGVSVLRLRAGELEVVQRTADDGRLEVGEVSAAALATVGGQRYAVIAARDEGEVSVWRVGASAPTRVQLRSARDGESRFDLTEVEDLAVATAGGEVLVFAAGPEKLVAYRLTAAGQLVRVGSTEGALALETAELDGRSLLFAAEEDRLRVYEIAAGGRLDLIETHRAGWGAEITDLAAVAKGDEVLLMAARADADGHDLFSYAEAGDDTIEAGRGDDTVRGGGGNDRIFGGDGEDRLMGEAGDDTVAGDAGADAVAGGAGDDDLRGGDGDDRLYGEAGDDAAQGDAGADRIEGGAGHDRLDGGTGDDSLDGGEGDDRILGGEGNDLARGGAGNDVIEGGAGDDVLEGGGGLDSLYGGAGDDELALADASDGRLWGGEGADRLLGAAGRDRLWGDSEADFLFGGEGADQLRGGEGADRLDAGADKDRLWGDAGKDQLSGGAGKDRLVGGEGNDRLDGGADADKLWGGAGRDFFVFGKGDGKDKVMDFAGKDRLVFEDVARFKQLDISTRKGDAVIEHKGGVVILDDVKAGALDVADFLFG